MGISINQLNMEREERLNRLKQDLGNNISERKAIRGVLSLGTPLFPPVSDLLWPDVLKSLQLLSIVSEVKSRHKELRWRSIGEGLDIAGNKFEAAQDQWKSFVSSNLSSVDVWKCGKRVRRGVLHWVWPLNAAIPPMVLMMDEIRVNKNTFAKELFMQVDANFVLWREKGPRLDIFREDNSFIASISRTRIEIVLVRMNEWCWSNKSPLFSILSWKRDIPWIPRDSAISEIPCPAMSSLSLTTTHSRKCMRGAFSINITSDRKRRTAQKVAAQAREWTTSDHPYLV